MLVIFDCDGVLVDTESISNALMAHMMTERGLPVTMQESRRRFVGLSLKAVREKVLQEDGVDLGEDFAAEVYARLPDVFAQGVEAVPNVVLAVEALRARGIPWCVASSGKIEKMHMTLGAAGLLPLFEDVLFSAWNVPRGKPFPDIFLHAARQMGHEPAKCIVVEDSVPGVVAGRAAGMRVLAYAGDPLSDRAGLEKAGGEVFDDMRDLPRLIGLSQEADA